MLSRIWGKRNTPLWLVGLQAVIITLEISLAVRQKIGNDTSRGLAIPLLGIYPEDFKACTKDICSTMFIVPYLY